MVNPNKPLHISVRVLSSSPCIDLATYLCTLSDNKRSVLFNIHSSHPYKTLFGNIIKVFLDKIQRYNELKYRGTKGVLNHVRIYKENFIISEQLNTDTDQKIYIQSNLI